MSLLLPMLMSISRLEKRGNFLEAQGPAVVVGGPRGAAPQLQTRTLSRVAIYLSIPHPFSSIPPFFLRHLAHFFCIHLGLTKRREGLWGVSTILSHTLATRNSILGHDTAWHDIGMTYLSAAARPGPGPPCRGTSRAHEPPPGRNAMLPKARESTHRER